MSVSAYQRDTSEKYEKVDYNVYRMKPVGQRPRRRILTDFGRIVVLIASVLLVVCAFGIYRLLY